MNRNNCLIGPMTITKLSSLPPDYFQKQREAHLPDVSPIIARVKLGGDRALEELTLTYDGIRPENIRVCRKDLEQAYHSLEPGLLTAQKEAARNVRRFSEWQKKGLRDFDTEIQPGVFAGQRIIPMDSVGIYVPGGRFPLFSSLIMAAVPAREAGVRRIIVCSPPQKEGSIHPAVLAAARLCGLDEVFQCGGAQAVAAMAYGTESIAPVDMIVGPGNVYVTAAKKAVFGRVGIDFIAGPTELLILADDCADPNLIASDLVGQAEHDDLAFPVLMTPSPILAEKVNLALLHQLHSLGPASLPSLRDRGLILLTADLDEAVEAANIMAPEHLALHCRDPETLAPKLRSYGSLFLGRWSAEALGDYSSGLNHILPTSGAARYTGGISILSFLKIQTVLRMEKQGLNLIGPAAMTMARAEGLEGHARSIATRLKLNEAGQGEYFRD